MAPDQGRHSVDPDMGPNCLQSLLADYKSHHYTTSKERINPPPPVGYNKCSKISTS